MYMKDSLPGLGVAIEDRSISAIGDAVLGCQSRGSPHHLSNDAIVTMCQVVHARDVAPGHDQDVHRRLRIDVLEGDEAIVRIDDIPGNLTSNDSAKEAICHCAF